MMRSTASREMAPVGGKVSALEWLAMAENFRMESEEVAAVEEEEVEEEKGRRPYNIS